MITEPDEKKRVAEATWMMTKMLSLRQDLKRALGHDYDERIEPHRVRFRALGERKLQVAAEAMLDLRATQVAIATIAAAVMDVYQEEATAKVIARRGPA
jgi:hypothetical protein